MSVRIVDGVGEIAGDYDGYIVDLWGVVHDGAKPFQGVLDAFRRLREAGKRIVLLSNAPRRIEGVAERLVEIGVARDAYDGLMSSGEETWRHLAERPDDWYRNLGRACFHIGPERDRGIREGLDLDFVGSIEAADFLLDTGTWRDEDAIEDYDALLGDAVSRKLPMVCANPDRIVVRAGVTELCAGAIAARYEGLGGEVRWHGKPDASVFEACFELLGVGDTRRILCAGDSLTTDIRGANGVGIAALLVTTGIHRDVLSDGGGEADAARIEEATAEAGVTATYATTGFQW